ncbi:hypothetical protein [uncultured Chitinophaga sp.]|jgi:hypothetical protein|uniref:hypothetical protein n=1 Tax=uncultured Chitinophaga sp. TaxID=339340 RepID=UPI002623833F|nr:hypothetical protein [uncultured Chitinophaga sp.]
MNTQLLQNLLQAGNLPVNNFPVTSRYYRTGTATIEEANGRNIIYLRRRMVPAADRFVLLQEYVVREGDRLDNIAATQIGNPEQFWQIADANNAIKPEALTDDIGARLRITQPENLTGF